MLNQVVLMGRLTASPELRHTQSGVAVATFRLAVDRDFKDKDGEKKADFLPVVCWRGKAEFVSKYFSKGRLVAVCGRLQVREYTTKDGDKRYATEIVADNVYFGDAKLDHADDWAAEPAPAPSGNFEDVDDDDDLPF